MDLLQGDEVRTGAGSVLFWLLELSALLPPWLLKGVATGGMAMLNSCASLSHGADQSASTLLNTCMRSVYV